MHTAIIPLTIYNKDGNPSPVLIHPAQTVKTMTLDDFKALEETDGPLLIMVTTPTDRNTLLQAAFPSATVSVTTKPQMVQAIETTTVPTGKVTATNDAKKTAEDKKNATLNIVIPVVGVPVVVLGVAAFIMKRNLA